MAALKFLNVAKASKHKNELKVVKAKMVYLQNALSKDKANPHMAANLWPWVNDILGRHRSPNVHSFTTGHFTGYY